MHMIALSAYGHGTVVVVVVEVTVVVRNVPRGSAMLAAGCVTVAEVDLPVMMADTVNVPAVMAELIAAAAAAVSTAAA
jgi:hypothetical protein